MAHWAEIDKNNIVLRVVVTDNNDPNGDEGYQWLIDNLGGRWLKTSYNTRAGKHLTGGTPFRGNYAGIGFTYNEELDAFISPSPFPSWTLNPEIYAWQPPTPKPDDGHWIWSEDTLSWVEFVPEGLIK